MAQPIGFDELPGSDTGVRFEGRDHGAQVSFFVSAHPPGTGAPPHRHPYEETFVVQEGEVSFMVEGARIVAHAGEIVVVPAGAVHEFVNSGDGVMRHVSIHPADHMQQELAEQ